jgi:oligosaccharide repeat unit polymerase
MNRISLYSLLIRIHALLIAITVFGCIYVAVTNNGEWIIAFLTIPLINILLIPLTRKGEKFDPTHPILMILMSLVIGTVLRSFFILSPMESDAKFLMLMGKPSAILLKGIFAIYLGLIVFVIGYIYPVKPLPDWSRKKIFSSEISLKKFMPVAIVLTAVSMITAYYYFEKVGVQYTLDEISQKRRYKLDEGGYAVLGYYRLCMDLIKPLYYIGIFYMVQKKKSLLSVFGFFTIFLGFLNLLYPFIVSSRTNALYVLLNTGLIIYFMKGRIKWKQIIQVFIVSSAVLVIMTAMRQQHSVTRSKTEADTNPLTIMVGSLEFLGVDKTSQIIDGMPDKLNYQFGETFILWLVAPIPRTMWTAKPDISYGLVIGDKIYEKREPDSAGGGVPPGFIAESYINFGYLGIVVFLFLLGMVSRLYYDAFVKVREKSMYAMLLYITVFIPFEYALIGGDFSGVVGKVIKGVVIIYLIMIMIQKKNDPAARLSK